MGTWIQEEEAKGKEEEHSMGDMKARKCRHVVF